MRIQVHVGDITQLAVDAIVNAANESLMGGGGVDGAIHAAAGPELVVASRKLAPCPAGEARLTPGFQLSAKFVIHAVGPIYRDGLSREAEMLASTYRSALAIASHEQFASIAFPCISTGAYRFPQIQACEIATQTVAAWLSDNAWPRSVWFCCFERSDFELYSHRLGAL